MSSSPVHKGHRAWLVAPFLWCSVLVGNATQADQMYVSLYDIGTVATLDTSVASPTPTTIATGLSHPAGMAFDATGNLYVSNTSGNTISRITPAGSVSTFASGLGEPESLVFDSTGNLYVAEAAANRISKITPGGTVSTFATAGLNGPVGLAMDASGTLFAANQFGGSVVEFSASGVPTTVIANLVTPADLRFDADGHLYVSVANGFGSTAGTVLKHTLGGATTTILSGLNNPANMAFDSLGNFYVADLGGTITRLAPNGAVGAFASGLAGPNGLLIVSSAIPEPASVALMSCGLSAVGLGVRRRRCHRSEDRGSSRAAGGSRSSVHPPVEITG